MRSARFRWANATTLPTPADQPDGGGDGAGPSGRMRPSTKSGLGSAPYPLSPRSPFRITNHNNTRVARPRTHPNIGSPGIQPTRESRAHHPDRPVSWSLRTVTARRGTKKIAATKTPRVRIPEKLVATVTMIAKSTNHQYSAREARPWKAAYFRKRQVRTASTKPIFERLYSRQSRTLLGEATVRRPTPAAPGCNPPPARSPTRWSGERSFPERPSSGSMRFASPRGNGLRSLRREFATRGTTPGMGWPHRRGAC